MIALENVKKPTRKKKEKAITDETLLKLIEGIRGENKKKANTIRGTLSAIPAERLLSLGMTEEELQLVPTESCRVFVFGTIGKLYSGNQLVTIGTDTPQTVTLHERDMRATHEYYNSLVRASEPYFVAFNKAALGPEGTKLVNLNAAIDAEYASIRAINQRSRSKKSSPEVEKILENIKTLRRERDPLFAASRKERNAFIKNNPATMAQLKKDLATAEKNCRANRPEYLWHGAYLAAESAFKLASGKAIKEGILPHLRNEFKGQAPDFLDNVRWNGEGSINAEHSAIAGKKSHDIQQWGEILAGNNKFLKVRKFTDADKANHGLKDTFRIREDMYLVSIKRGDGSVKSDSYVSAAVILHRQPKLTDRIVTSLFITRKKGLRHVTTLNLSVKYESGTATGTDVVYVLPKWDNYAIVGNKAELEVAQWKNGSETGTVNIPYGHVSTNRSKDGSEKIITATQYCAELDGIVTVSIGIVNSIRTVFGLSPESRGTLRFIGRPNNLLAETLPGVNREQAFKNISLSVRARHDNAPWGGAGENDLKNFVMYAYKDFTKYFSFPDESQGINFVTAWLFRERYQHIYPWSVNVRSSALLNRREIYRVAAARLLKNAVEVHIPNRNYCSRFLDEKQKVASPSELLLAIKNYAQREGIQVISEDEEIISANL